VSLTRQRWRRSVSMRLGVSKERARTGLRPGTRHRGNMIQSQ